MKKLIEVAENLSAELIEFEKIFILIRGLEYPEKLEIAWSKLTEQIQLYYEGVMNESKNNQNGSSKKD